MNRLSIISAFLGGVRNRYIQYHADRSLEEKFKLAAQVKEISGFELCYPADFSDIKALKTLLSDYGYGVSSVNVRSRRDGRWLRGSFSSASPREREEVIDDFRRATDAAVDIGCARISTCPLNDGHDYVFEMNYFDAYRYAEETFGAICRHNPGVRVCIEYKWNDPRTRCLFATAGETLSFCQSVGADNLGVTLDIGHSIQSGERPAQSVALLQRAGRLFYVHLNDNDRHWDWDMMPGAYNFWDFIEFFYYLDLAGYQDDWYAFDVLSKEVDLVEHFQVTARLTRRLEALAGRIDGARIQEMAQRRNPAEIMTYLYETVIR